MEYGLVVLWWVAYVGLALFGLPIAARLFSSLPGRGAGFSLGISLTILTLVAFWVGYLALGWVALVAGLSVLALAAVLSVRAGVEVDRRAAGEALVVFTLVYVGVLVLRSVDPGITPQGEKFLDFGLMASLYRSARLPPEDFWFAGKSLIYYYGGHFLGALLTRLTGTHPWYGFNLVMAGFFGMLASGAYELAGAVAAGRREDVRTDTGGLRNTGGLRDAAPDRYDRHTRVLAGATAVFFTVCASNLSTAARLLVRNLPRAIRGEAATLLASAHSQLPAYQLLRPIPKQGYEFRVAGRLIPETYDPFPLFGAVRGDIRPYLTSTPFLLCAAGLCYAYYRTPGDAVRRRRALVFGAIPVVGGFMAIVNTWSFPTVLGLLWLTLTFAPTDLRSLLPGEMAACVDSVVGRPAADTPRGLLARMVGAGGFAAGVGFVGVLVVVPFFLGPVSSRAIVTLAAEARSPLGSLVLIHGAFLTVFVTYLLARARDRFTDPVAAAGVLWFLALLVLVPATLAPLALFAPVLLVGWYALATDREVGFEGVLMVAGLGLVLIAELLYVQEGGDGRFNTVVKTYMPAWILWASAAGVMLPRLVRGRGRWSWTRRRQQIGAVLAALLLISTAVYGGVALRSHFADSEIEEPTLDGMAAAERNIPGQVNGIEWLYERPGRPTFVSAPGRRVYVWSASPAASLTGVPTVAGVSHEAQFRSREAYISRVYAINTIYLGSDERRAALLEQYGVEYIYVGPTERARYGYGVSFDEMRGVQVAYENRTATIYSVNQERLNAS